MKNNKGEKMSEKRFIKRKRERKEQPLECLNLMHSTEEEK